MNNVTDLKGENGLWLKSYTPEYGVHHRTRAAMLWDGIGLRCKVGGALQDRRPTYIGCTNGFKDFQEFAEWCQYQYGYTHKEDTGKFWQLDKDLKYHDNKVYSPETCIFVPHRVNSFLLNSKKVRGDSPIGVNFDKNSQKFRAQCCSGKGSQKHLGLFNCQQEAHKAWQRYKVEMIRDMCSNDFEIREHTELVSVLLEQAKRIENDLLNNIETK